MSNSHYWLHHLGTAGVLVCALLCEGSAATLPKTQSAETVQTPATSPGGQPAVPETVTLEFEPPPEFHERTEDGAYVITGFRVGYFRAAPDDPRKNAQPRPVHATFIARDALQLVGPLVRVSFKPEPMRRGNTEVVFRVQAVRSGADGYWSDPTGVMTLAERAPASGRRVKKLTLEESVATYPALVEALRALDAKAQGPRPETQKNPLFLAFRRVGDLATAVVICRDRGVPCAELAESMIGPPRQPLGRALRQWIKEESEIPGLIKKARSESRRLLRKTVNKK